MTNEEAVKMLKAKRKCLILDVSGVYDDCNRKLCNECYLNYEQGNMGQQAEYLRMSIEALAQEPILDKIRAEIQKLRGCSCSCSDGIIDDVEDIIDKYRK